MIYLHNNAYVRYLSLECLLLDYTVGSCTFPFSAREKSLGAQRGERSGLSSYVNVSVKPCEGMIKGEPIISWLHNVCAQVTLLSELVQEWGGGVFEVGVSRVDN